MFNLFNKANKIKPETDKNSQNQTIAEQEISPDSKEKQSETERQITELNTSLQKVAVFKQLSDWATEVLDQQGPLTDEQKSTLKKCQNDFIDLVVNNTYYPYVYTVKDKSGKTITQDPGIRWLKDDIIDWEKEGEARSILEILSSNGENGAESIIGRVLSTVEAQINRSTGVRFENTYQLLTFIMIDNFRDSILAKQKNSSRSVLYIKQVASEADSAMQKIQAKIAELREEV